MSVGIPEPIRRARRTTGLILLLTSVLTVAVCIAVAYLDASRPVVVGALTSSLRGGAEQMPADVVGHWRGDVSQTGGGVWVADIELRDGAVNSVIGSGTYPILECSGTLTLLRVVGDSIDVMVTMTHGNVGVTCLPRHFATLEPATDGSLVYRDSQDSDIEFYGILARQL